MCLDLGCLGFDARDEGMRFELFRAWGLWFEARANRVGKDSIL